MYMSFITSAKQVMVSSALVCLLAELCRNDLTDFHNNRWKAGTWAMEETVRCRWYSGSLYTLRLRLGYRVRFTVRWRHRRMGR